MPSAPGMWLTVDLETFEVAHEGFVQQGEGPRRLYLTPGLRGFDSMAQLAESEFAQAVEVDAAGRTVTFGRDYLGHHPLSYACTGTKLHISDDVTTLVAALRKGNIEPRLCAEALALYFSAGFVPQGMSAYSEIVNCESASLYRWEKGAVRKNSLFQPVEIEPSFPLSALEEAIDGEVDKCARMSDAIDVWCSGGLDSSIMAYCFNRGGRRARLLTLAYGEDIEREHGEAERAYARELARALGAPLQDVEFTAEAFDGMHSLSARSFNTPVVNVLAPKFALARASSGLVVTGEGGDNLFGPTKNSVMLYALAKSPSIPRGYLYALAHRQFATRLPEIFRRGEELKDYVTGYFNAQLALYPGDMVRKLFYLDALLKPGSMIFAQSYYPGRVFGRVVRHPLASLAVYKAAFAMPDAKKYSFPRTKLALTELYGSRLPQAIVNRKKTGTLVPLSLYMKTMPRDKFDLAPLEDSGLFKAAFLNEVARTRHDEAAVHLRYAVMTLNEWLRARQGMSLVQSRTDEGRQNAV